MNSMQKEKIQKKKKKKVLEVLEVFLAWYPNKMRRYPQRNPKCGDWCWTNFQMQVALFNFYFIIVLLQKLWKG